jgi:hypothetical protein
MYYFPACYNYIVLFMWILLSAESTLWNFRKIEYCFYRNRILWEQYIRKWDIVNINLSLCCSHLMKGNFIKTRPRKVKSGISWLNMLGNNFILPIIQHSVASIHTLHHTLCRLHVCACTRIWFVEALYIKNLRDT